MRENLEGADVGKPRRSRAKWIGVAALGGVLVLAGFVVVAVASGRGSRETQWLGMEIEPVTADLCTGLGLPADQKGVFVSDVVGAAYSAGVREGDVIVAVNNRSVSDVSSFRDAIQTAGTAAGATLTVNRFGSMTTVAVSPADQAAGAQPAAPGNSLVPVAWPAPGRGWGGGMGAGRPGCPASPVLYPGPPAWAPPAQPIYPAAATATWGTAAPRALGLVVQELGVDKARSLGLSPPYHGVLVAQVQPQSPAEAVGLRYDDIIFHVNGYDVMSVDQFWGALSTQAVGTTVSLGVWRAGQTLQVAILVQGG